MKRARCPMCHGPMAPEVTSRHYPFCSERCQLLDLGHWLREDYSIPAQTEQRPDDNEPGETGEGKGR